jgi:hypothetical protein
MKKIKKYNIMKKHLKKIMKTNEIKMKKKTIPNKQ